MKMNKFMLTSLQQYIKNFRPFGNWRKAENKNDLKNIQKETSVTKLFQNLENNKRVHVNIHPCLKDLDNLEQLLFCLNFILEQFNKH